MGAAGPGISGGLQLLGSFQQARALEAQSEFQAERLALNARLAKIQADDAIRRGERAAQFEFQRASQIAGAQRAGFAGQGVVIDQDTPGILLEQTDRVAREAAETVRLNAVREAFGFRVQEEDILGRIQLLEAATETRVFQTLASGGLSFVQGLNESGAFGEE